MLIRILLISALIIMAIPDGSAGTRRSVLMVLSSHGEDAGETRPGYEFDEFSKAWLVFDKQGYHVDIASPQGGVTEADHFDPSKPFNAMVMSDTVAMERLSNTIPTAEIDYTQYDAVYIVGGKGAMFDLPFDEALQRIVAGVYEQGGIVSAVCHGPAALTNVRLNNGRYLVDGMRVNGFTNSEEMLFGKKWKQEYPFLLEDRLVERGGLFESAPMMLSHVAVDGRLITGQNPASTIAIAQAVVRALADMPVSMPPFKDDATMALIANFLDGDLEVIQRLHTSADEYEMPLVAAYGHYFIEVAESRDQIESAVRLMEAANASMRHPILGLSIVRGYELMQEPVMALDFARELAAQFPDNQDVQSRLTSLEND